MLKLSDHSRKFLQENNINLLLLLEDSMVDQQNQTPATQAPVDPSMNSDDAPAYNQDAPNSANTNPDGGDGQVPTGMEQADPAIGPDVVPANQMPTIEDILDQDLNIADTKFIQFRLYDKITNLQDLITNLKNITTLNEDERDTLEHFADYVIILNELIFTLDVNVIYQLIGQVEIDMTTFLDEINERALQKIEARKQNENGGFQ